MTQISPQSFAKVGTVKGKNSRLEEISGKQASTMSLEPVQGTRSGFAALYSQSEETKPRPVFKDKERSCCHPSHSPPLSQRLHASWWVMSQRLVVRSCSETACHVSAVQRLHVCSKHLLLSLLFFKVSQTLQETFLLRASSALIM